MAPIRYETTSVRTIATTGAMQLSYEGSIARPVSGGAEGDRGSRRLLAVFRFLEDVQQLLVVDIERPLLRGTPGRLGKCEPAGRVEELLHAPGQLGMIVRIADHVAVATRRQQL